MGRYFQNMVNNLAKHSLQNNPHSYTRHIWHWTMHCNNTNIICLRRAAHKELKLSDYSYGGSSLVIVTKQSAATMGSVSCCDQSI